MDLLDAIKQTKIVRRFSFEALSDSSIENIKKHFYEIGALNDDIDTDFEIVDNRQSKKIKGGFLSVNAPYYIIFYSKKTPGAYRNIGFKIQQITLYLTTMGLISKLKHDIKIDKELKTKRSLEACAVIGFGREKEYESGPEPMTLVQLSVYKDNPKSWVNRLLEMARLAPSYKNSQPWRFLIESNEFHIFYKGKQAKKMNKDEEIDIGRMLANIVTASDELWFDIKFVRKENTEYKSLTKDQYIISILPDNKFGIY